MKTIQKQWSEKHGWTCLSDEGDSEHAQLALAFGDIDALQQTARLDEIRQSFPNARLVGCSTGGEILGGRVFDNTLTVTSVWFEHSGLAFAETVLDSTADSFNAGQRLADALDPDGLAHVLVLSDGLKVDGSALAYGLHARLPAHVAVTGGLAGDQSRFQQTQVFLDVASEDNSAVAIGFYGDTLQIGYGSQGGWDSFGPDRRVTRAEGNILYELDGQPILDLYRTYLGDLAQGLPATGLFFPLSLTLEGSDQRLVRTIQAVNTDDGSATFTSVVPEGSYARLMKGNFERLVDGAAESARQALVAGPAHPHLAILISCLGRKLVLKQRIDEEVESVQNVLGPDATIAGFYSYGEICPVDPTEPCAEFHNQTMTITTLSECQN